MSTRSALRWSLLLLAACALAGCASTDTWVSSRSESAAEPTPAMPPPAAILLLPASGAPEEFESAPTLPLRVVAPGIEAFGPGYRINDPVLVDDYFGRFTLRSDVGTLETEGSELLALRLAELPAVRELDRVSTTGVFADSVQRGVRRPIQAVGQVVREPGQTLAGLPSGIGRFVVRTARSVRDTVLDISDAARDARAEREAAEQDPDAQAEALTAEDEQDAQDDKTRRIAESAALRYIGYNKARREIAQQVGVDPYSTNPLLDERLDRLAWASWSGSVVSGLGVGLVGGVAGQAIGVAKDAYELVWELPPADLRRRNLNVLAELGISGKPARDFARNSAFTLTQQTEFVELLRQDEFAAARMELFELALTAEREVHARYLISSLRMLQVEALRNRPSHARSVVIGHLPALRRPDGSFIVAMPVDHLYWTAEIAGLAEAEELLARRNLLLVTGSLSEQARNGFSRAGWQVREGVRPSPEDFGPAAAEPTDPLPED